MRITVGDIWTQPIATVVVPVNWTTNVKGLAVMGRGIAKQCSTMYPYVARQLGNAICETPYHTHVVTICTNNHTLALLPVKYHWKDKADMPLIRKGVKYLADVQRENPNWEFTLPLLGCGFGGLEVLPVLTLLSSLLPSPNAVLVLRDDTTVISKYKESFRYSTLAKRGDKSYAKVA